MDEVLPPNGQQPKAKKAKRKKINRPSPPKKEEKTKKHRGIQQAV